MKNIKKTISLLLMVALLLPILPISDMIALAAGPNDIIMYINDVAITAERCQYKDGSSSTVPIIVGTQNGIMSWSSEIVTP